MLENLNQHDVKSVRVFIPGSTTDLGQSQTDSPDLTLIAQAILADELKLGVTIIIGQSWFTIDLNRVKLMFSGR